MKRIFFISGALAIVSSMADADNIINGNPFYSPMKGRFYNVLTPIEFNTKFEQFYLRDEFGFGITDALTVSLSTVASYDSSDNPEFGKWAWNNLGLELDWSILGQGENQADIYVGVMQVYNTKHDLEAIEYDWKIGARVGRMTKKWTLAGVVEINYIKDDVSQYDKDAWAMTVGIQGQYLLNSHWNITGELDFDFDLYDVYYNEMRLVFELGVNYNISPTKYIGIYTSKDVTRDFDVAPMVFGGRFGIDF